jgi:superfamily I DNA/RNA helicase
MAYIEKIFGAPGTGKTFTLVERLNSHLKNKNNPSAFDKTLTITFTKVAAREIRNRIGDYSSFSNEELEHQVRTIHSYIWQKIRGENRDICYASDFIKNYYNVKTERELNPEKKIPFYNAYDIIEKGRIKVGDGIENILKHYDDQFKEQKGYGELCARSFLIGVAESYINYKKNYSKVDWVDVLYKGLNEKIIFEQQEVLILDEAQDCNRLEWLIVNKLIEVSQYVYIAGDDDQAIYRFKGALVEHFLKLTVNKSTVLKESPRLNKEIYKLSRAIIHLIPKENRQEKIFTPTNIQKGLIQRFRKKELLEQKYLHRPVHDNNVNIHWLFLARTHKVLDMNYANDTYSWSQILAKNNLTWEVVPKKEKYNGDERGTTPNIYPHHIHDIKTWLALQKGEKILGQNIKDFFQELDPILFRERKKTSLIQKDSIILKNGLYNYEDLKTRFYFDADIKKDWSEILELKPRNPDIYSNYVQYLRNVMKNGNYAHSKRILFSTIHGAKGLESANVVLNTDWTFKPYETYRKGGRWKDDEIRMFYVGVTRTKTNLFFYEPDFSFGEYKGMKHNNFFIKMQSKYSEYE